MPPRVIVARDGVEYLCIPASHGRWRCGRCRRGYLRQVSEDEGYCAVCRAKLVAVSSDFPTVPIPPAGQVRTVWETERVPQGWDLVCHVRALRGEFQGQELTAPRAAILAWQALSVAIQQGGNDLTAMVARLDAASQPEDPGDGP